MDRWAAFASTVTGRRYLRRQKEHAWNTSTSKNKPLGEGASERRRTTKGENVAIAAEFFEIFGDGCFVSAICTGFQKIGNLHFYLETCSPNV